jgi:hypothetical protein
MEIFSIGDRIDYNPSCFNKGKIGTIQYLRDCSYERDMRKRYPSHPYYYCVKFDDGTMDTYVSGTFMKKINDRFVFKNNT